MIFATTKAIDAAIKAKGWSCSITEQGQTSIVVTGFNMKSGSAMQVFFISTAENDVAVRVFQFIPVPAGKEAPAYKVCNDMNYAYRFVRFMVGSGYVNIQADIPVTTANVAEVATELLMRLLNIADEAYPKFQEALAGGEKKRWF